MAKSDSILKQFGNKVRELRKTTGLSQEAFADLCKLDRTYIGGVERGERNVSLKNIALIADALGVTISELTKGLGSPMNNHLETLNKLYGIIKTAAKSDLISEATGKAIHDLSLNALRFLQSDCTPVPCKSLVAGKSYITYRRNDIPGVVCRPANTALFNADPNVVSAQWQAWWDGRLSHSDLASMSYTIALAPCLAMELFDRQNKKQPATFFECLVGHIFAKAIGTNPYREQRFSIEGQPARMTMDFLFNMPNGARHIHLPVKMSTRERVVQAWAHQRLLDAAFGNDTYKGLMILFSETKLDNKKLEVVEICVPDQWLVYQSLLSRMERIYYFDVPVRYAELTRKFPVLLPIKNFGEFFTEKEAVLAS